MKTLLTVTQDINKYQIRTDNKHPIYLIEKEYSEEEYKKIHQEADEWEIEYVNENGYDYGYDRSESNTITKKRAITDEELIVEDGHFVGAMKKSSGVSYGKRTTAYTDLYVALIKNYKGQKMFIARIGDSHYSDDHERWDLTYYYLKKK